MADLTEPQDLDPAPHLLLVAMLFETISTHTVMSDGGIGRHLVESTANDHSLPEDEEEIKQALSPLLVAAEDTLLETALLVVVEMTTLNRLISSQTWLA